MHNQEGYFEVIGEAGTVAAAAVIIHLQPCVTVGVARKPHAGQLSKKGVLKCDRWLLSKVLHWQYIAEPSCLSRMGQLISISLSVKEIKGW